MLLCTKAWTGSKSVFSCQGGGSELEDALSATPEEDFHVVVVMQALATPFRVI
jgi:hypothetical protein